MNVTEFVAKWRRAQLSERSASQQHFLDLCEVLDHPKPAEVDATGESFTFERGATKQDGGDGWADVWKRGFFGWEYKGKHRDLDVAYHQLLKYREALENPPLLVVCDMDCLVVHSNFTNTPHVVYEIPLEKMGEPRSIEILRAVFHAPERLKPGTTSEVITAAAAEQLAQIAGRLRDRGLDPREVAQFLDRIVFCLFAEDIGLLPTGLFARIVEKTKTELVRFKKIVGHLFDAMAHGGDFGMETIRHFNGSLFTISPVLELTEDEIERIHVASRLDWSTVDPSVFGTLFERGMDPAKRSQLGAHYTSRADIERLIEPVVMAPLRREWAEANRLALTLVTTGRKKPKERDGTPTRAQLKKGRTEAQSLVQRFLHRLQSVKILDPACGSGNFLYVTLQKLKDLEKEVFLFADSHGIGGFLPLVGPWQLCGIETSEYAFDLAQMTVWIGYLQWTRQNGFGWPQDPVLRPMNTFHRMDAILDMSDPAHPREPEWPTVDFIVGNPPFLGDKFMRGELGDEYVDKLRELWAGRVPGGADLCCYWFEKARRHIEDGKCKRAGLLATQGIRGGANREVLKRIKGSGDIFFAISDSEWVLDGANVHISMIGFDGGAETVHTLDGAVVPQIQPNLGSLGADLSTARRLSDHERLAFIGTTKKAPLDISFDVAIDMLRSPNPHRRPNSDVLRLYLNAADVTGRTERRWIIDFGADMDEGAASLYERPFRHVRENVYPLRRDHREPVQRTFWWRLARPCPDLFQAVRELPRFLVTTVVSKHRLFAWQDAPINPDHQLVVFVRSDDYLFGILQSRVHEVWALKMGTRLETRPRYTPTTCFETFPFPTPPEVHRSAIAEAARELNTLRENWLNPPEWIREEVLEFPGSTTGPWSRYVRHAGADGIGTVRFPRSVPRDADSAAKLAKRTMTNLYNARPEWLAEAHRRLDEAVFAAYGWLPTLTDDQILTYLLQLNLARPLEAV